MQRIIDLPALILICILLVSCSNADGDELNALKALHAKEQAAHLSNNVLLFDEIFGDTLCQVKSGQISYLPHDQITARFKNYFNSVKFVKWENIQEPIYILSEDATLANILVQKHVELIANNDSTRTIQKTDFAWTELWRKRNGQWRLYSITSTDKLSE